MGGFGSPFSWRTGIDWLPMPLTYNGGGKLELNKGP